MGERDRAANLWPTADPAPAPTRATLGEALALFRNRSLVLLTLSYGALSYVQYMFFYWIEYYFGKVLNLPSSESRQAAFTVTIAMAVGMAGGGWVSDVFVPPTGVPVGRPVDRARRDGVECRLQFARRIGDGPARGDVVLRMLAMGSLGHNM